MSTKSIFLAVLAILLVIAVVGAFVYFGPNKDEETPITDEGTTNTETETPAELMIETVTTEGVALSFMKLAAPASTMPASSDGYLSTAILSLKDYQAKYTHQRDGYCHDRKECGDI